MSIRRSGCAFCLSHLKRIPAAKMGPLRLKTVSGPGQIPGAGIFHVSLPPRTSHDMIYHKKTREWFMVVSGRGRGIIGGRSVVFKPGVIVYMPPGVPHRMMTGTESMDALVVFSPPLKLKGRGADVHRAKEARSS
jgi:mannose-6-phosphate isomerase-like protein (cupin superfamily)